MVSLRNKNGAESGNRTYNLLITIQLLYQLSYFGTMAEKEGFEPPRRLHALSVFKTDPFSRAWVFLQRKGLYLMVVDPVGLEPTTDRL